MPLVRGRIVVDVPAIVTSPARGIEDEVNGLEPDEVGIEHHIVLEVEIVARVELDHLLEVPVQLASVHYAFEGSPPTQRTIEVRLDSHLLHGGDEYLLRHTRIKGEIRFSPELNSFSKVISVERLQFIS